MDRQDDPETRIRELERPLSEQARASEMGVAQPGSYANSPTPQPGGYANPPTPPPGGYANPPTPPPVTYGAPFPTTPMRTAGFRVWWIVLALFAVGAVALAGGIAAFSAHLFSSVSSTIGSATNRPTISPGNGLFTRIPSSRPGPSAGGTQAPTPPPPGGRLSVAGIGENETIACNDSFVDVSGFSNTVVITGHCASLTVSGAKNAVTVDATDTIDASGFNNQVTFHTGSPQVDKSGESNVVQQG